MAMRYENRLRVSWVDTKEDRETAFVKKHCARYLVRHLEHTPALEEPDLDFAVWVLGSQVKMLVDAIIPLLRGKDAGKHREKAQGVHGSPRHYGRHLYGYTCR